MTEKIKMKMKISSTFQIEDLISDIKTSLFNFVGAVNDGSTLILIKNSILHIFVNHGFATMQDIPDDIFHVEIFDEYIEVNVICLDVIHQLKLHDDRIYRDLIRI